MNACEEVVVVAHWEHLILQWSWVAFGCLISIHLMKANRYCICNANTDPCVGFS